MRQTVPSTNSINVDFAVSVGQVQRAASVRADVRSPLVGSPGGFREREERGALLPQQRQGLFVLLQVRNKRNTASLKTHQTLSKRRIKEVQKMYARLAIILYDT